MADMSELAELVGVLEDQLAICVKCGVCQAVCPVFEQTGKEADVARGKLALLDGLIKNRFSNAGGVKKRLDRCLLCGSCAANCPSGVNVLEIFIRARAVLAEFLGLSPVKKMIFRKMLAKPETFDRITELAGKSGKIFVRNNRSVQNTASVKFISPLISQRHFPLMAAKSLHSTLFSQGEKIAGINTSRGRSGIKVAFFTGCLIDKIFPGIGFSCLDALAFHGVGVCLPRNQGCCGMPALASGDMLTFEALVEHHIRLFQREKFDYLVTACATCTSSIKKIWPSIYRGKNSGFKRYLKELSRKTLDINRFLVKHCVVRKNMASEVLKNGIEARREDSSISMKYTKEHSGYTGYSEQADSNAMSGQKEIVTYHDPCHLKKSLGVTDEPRTLIRVSGYDLREMATPDRCCGMGGSFNLFHYDLSAKIGYLKQKEIAGTHCSIVATGCPACMIQISDMLAKSNLEIRVKHPVELYAESLKPLIRHDGKFWDAFGFH